MKKLLLLPLLLLVQSCANIPLSTMLSLSQFGPDDFLAIEPEQLRTKIVMTDPLRPSLEATTLNVILSTPRGMLNHTFDVAQVSEHQVAAVDGLLFDEPAKNEFVYKLSPAAVENFIQVQREFADIQANNDNLNYEIEIATTFKGWSETVDDPTLSILIQFEETQDYVLLIDEASIEVSE